MKKLLVAICILAVVASLLTACGIFGQPEQPGNQENPGNQETPGNQEPPGGEEQPGTQGKPEEEVKIYNISFVDHDGTEVHTATFKEGEEIVFSAENPSREADAQYTYQFIGWANEDGIVLAQLPAATKDAQFTAYYNKTVNSYNVVFMNGEESLQSETLEYGAEVLYNGEAPTTPADAQYTYVFSGWTDGENNYLADEALPTVTGDVTYTALFSSTLNSYTITWNILGEESTAVFNYGETAVYEGTPEKPATVQYSYTFIGWARAEDGEVLAADEMTVLLDDTYYAVFSATVNSYLVSFVDENDNLLFSESVEYGANPEFKGTLPTLENNAQYSYEYLGWVVGDAVYSFEDRLPKVTGEITFKLKLETTVNEYKVTWIVEGQSTEKVLAYGATPEFKGTPAKDSTAEYEYSFLGWSLTEGGEIIEIPTVTADATYYAVFEAVKNQYEVKFVDADGNELYKATVNYGESVSYSGELPVKEATAQYSYIPMWQLGDATYGADESFVVTGAATYVLGYTEQINKYTITISYEGVPGGAAPETKTVTLDYGTAYDKANTESPAVEGYAPNYYWFAGILTENVNYTVKYSLVDVWDGTTATAFASGTGTAEDPYIIMTGAQLAYLGSIAPADTAGKYYKLGSSLDLSAHNWTPISYRGSATNYTWTFFQGHFDGAGYTINFVIDQPKGRGFGLFQNLGATSSLKNLTLTGSVTCMDRAGAAGYQAQAGSVIENVINYTNVNTPTTTGDIWVGGIIGTSGATIRNCENYGSVTAKGKMVGGIAGKASTLIENCVNYGFVSTANTLCGGITGQSTKNTVIKSCVNYGTVTTTSSRCGGIVGETTTSTIHNCTNYGTITGVDTTSGIGGNMTSSTIISLCTNYGSVNGAGAQVAGITSYIGAGSKVLGCVNYGTITNTSSDTAGIQGTNKGYVGDYIAEDGTVYHCINYGSVTGVGTRTGGIVGNTGAGITENCINYGTITGTSAVGGIAGQTASSSTTQLCINHGQVNGSGENVAGISGYVGAGSNVLGCANHGDVNSTSLDVGGIAGENQGYVGGYADAEGNITKTVNYGNIYSTSSNVGGITGYNFKVSATTADAENYGYISGNASYIGGCIGRNVGGTASNLTNYGEVTALRAAEEVGTGIGGVIGSNQESSVASNLTNHGTVIGYTQVGGVSGYQGAGSSIDVAVNNGKVYGYTDQVGQIVGYNNAPDETTNVTENGSAEVVVEGEEAEE